MSAATDSSSTTATKYPAPEKGQVWIDQDGHGVVIIKASEDGVTFQRAINGGKDNFVAPLSHFTAGTQFKPQRVLEDQQSSEAGYTVEEWIYGGMRVAKGDKPTHVWYSADGREHWYDKVSGSTPGAVYRVSLTEEGQSVIYRGPNAPRYLRSIEADDPRRIGWSVRHHEAKALIESVRAAKRAGDDDPFLAALEPIRARYQRATAPEKRALLAAVLERITGGR